MLKFKESDYIWSKTENPGFFEEYTEAFYFNCAFNTIRSLYKNFIFDQQCAIFYKL